MVPTILLLLKPPVGFPCGTHFPGACAASCSSVLAKPKSASTALPCSSSCNQTQRRGRCCPLPCFKPGVPVSEGQSAGDSGLGLLSLRVGL